MELNQESLLRGSVRVELAGEPVQLLPERAVYIESSRTLLVADLHWGKAETFQARGIRVPSELLQSDLRRLNQAVAQTGAARVLVLGDLVHSPRHLGEGLVRDIAEWRARQNVSMALVPGNHDRGLKLPPEWNIELAQDPLAEGVFEYTHDAFKNAHHAEATADRPSEARVNGRAGAEKKEASKKFVWSGHVHPTLRLKSGADSLRAPCFVLTDSHGLLPAFSEFTGGFDMSPGPRERYYMVAEGMVITLGSKK